VGCLTLKIINFRSRLLNLHCKCLTTKMLKVYIIECENAKVWTPINGEMFKTCLPEDGENDRIELQIFNVVNENKVPDDILSYDAIIITGSRFNCRDGDTLPWFEPLCNVVRAAAEEGKPKVYAGW